MNQISLVPTPVKFFYTLTIYSAILLKKGGIAIEIHHFDVSIPMIDIFYSRIPHDHPQKTFIEAQMNNMKIGYRGEAKLLRFLEEVNFKQSPLVIRNFLTRVHQKRIIQIDYLLVTRKYLLIIEVKNIAGHIQFNSNPPQMIRTLEGRPSQAMDCPFVQLDRNLDGFIASLPDSKLPIYTSLVWANSSTTFDLPFEAPHLFLTLKKVPLMIQELEKLPDLLSNKQFNALKKRIVQKAQSFQEQSFCDRYQINPLDLRKGLYCVECYQLLTKSIRTWICTNCKLNATQFVDVNVLSLFSIQNPQLTITDIRNHLPELQSRQVRKVLDSYGYISKGNTKSKRYFKPMEWEEHQ